MPHTGNQFAELFIAKEDGRSTIRLFTARPTPLEEKNLGRLFGVLEIDSQDAINDDILHVIEDVVVAEYYRAETIEVETAFEGALQQLNKKMQELVAEFGEEWLNSLNMLIGVQKDHSLLFANIGHVIAMLIQENDILDVLDTTKAKAEELNPMKVFTNIVTGEAPKDSAVLFATETMLDYLSKEKIRRIVFGNAPEVAVQEFRSLLEEDTTNSNFASIIFEYRTATVGGTEHTSEIPVVNTAQRVASTGTVSSDVDPNDSMEELMGRQHNTEELLSNSIWPSIRKSMRNYVDRRGTDKPTGPPETHSESSGSSTPGPSHPTSHAYTASEEKEREQPRSAEETVGPLRAEPSTGAAAARSAGRVAAKGGRAAYGVAKKAVVGVTGWTVQVIRQSRSNKNGDMAVGRRQSRGRSAGIGDKAASGVSGALSWFNALSLLQRAFLVVAVIVLVLFAQSVINRGEANLTTEQETEFAQTITDIDLKINEGKAAALFDNEKARTLYIEARDLLASVPEDSDAFKDRGEELQAVIAAELEQVNNITRIETPVVAVDYRSINPEIEVGNIMLLGASMYGFDANNRSVYRGNLETQESTVTISESISTPLYTVVSKASPGTGVVGLSDSSFATFNPIAESLSPVELSIENTERSVVDIVVFGVRLYTLDTANNQIFRHRSAGDGFEAGESWLAGNEDLAGAVSMAIDGNIYVLFSTGEVRRYAAGAREEFSLAPLDPALNSGTTLYTDENTERLYVLDGTNKRVVVFSKEGGLEAQYTSDAFVNPRDMVVDEAAGKIYILDEGRVYEIQIDDQQADAGTDSSTTSATV